MDPIKKKVMAGANQMARRREQAIKAVLNHFFPDGWTEEGIAKRCSSEVYPNFREILFVDGEAVLEFGELEFSNDIDVDNRLVTCTYSQTVKVLY